MCVQISWCVDKKSFKFSIILPGIESKIRSEMTSKGSLLCYNRGCGQRFDPEDNDNGIHQNVHKCSVT